METKKEHYSGQRGNVLVYVLIAIVLFAALSFTLSRQTDTGEAGILSEEQAEIYANQIISYSAQAKSAIDQMLFSGMDVDELDFTDPSAAGFNTGTQSDRIKRVFHPEGGGLNKGRLSDDMTTSAISDPNPGWDSIKETMIDDTLYTGSNVDLPTDPSGSPICANCHEMAMLCVRNQDQDAYAFYAVIADQ